MKLATATIKGVSPYSQGRYHATEKLNKENHKDYEKRTWRERFHTNEDGFIFIPPMAFKHCLSECAKFLSIQIPGKGKATYTKHFDAGLMVPDALVLDVTKDDLIPEWLLVPSDGKVGGTTRVEKCFGIINGWGGDVDFLILDETITEEVFTNHLVQAGQFIGLGRWRPRNRGMYGRFMVENIEFGDYEI